MNRLMSLFMERRGYTADYLRSIEDSTHAVLKDTDKLCEQLADIRNKSDLIVVLPDFDMDGIMAGVVGYAGLSELGFHCALFLPDPGEGYGFDAKTIDRLLSEYPDAKAILTCDTGIDCHEGIARAKAAGLSVLVTDHHTVRHMPAADVVVDPMRDDDPYEHTGICGAHVLYQCLQYFANQYCDYFMREQMYRLRVFAGIGTISDSMPVLYENRKLIRDAIAVCRYIYAEGDDSRVNALPGCDVYRRAFRGLFDVLSMFEEEGRISCPDNIDENFFGFYMAPVFNSVKRMNGSMADAFGAFFSGDRVSCVERLYALNEQRKVAVQQWLDELEDSSQPFAPYIYITKAPEGVLGLMAMRIMSQTGMPVTVVRKDDTDGVYIGSGRSPSWYPFLNRTDGLPIKAAGHQQAFGVRYADDASLLCCYLHFVSDVPSVMSTLPEEEESYDIVISSCGDGDTFIDVPLMYGFLYELEYMRPFGKGFAEPAMKLRFRASDGVWSAIGSNHQHLKIALDHGFSVLCWNQASVLQDMDVNSDAVVDVFGKLSVSEFRGVQTMNFTGNVGVVS